MKICLLTLWIYITKHTKGFMVKNWIEILFMLVVTFNQKTLIVKRT